MGYLRTLILCRRHGARLLFAAVLLIRAIVPAGYMIGLRDGVPTIELCNGMVAAAPHHMAAISAHDMSQISHHDMASMAQKGETPAAPAEAPVDGAMPCAFAAANFAPTLVSDPLLPLAIIRIASMQPMFARRAMVFVPSAFPHARPFLRGPPPLS